MTAKLLTLALVFGLAFGCAKKELPPPPLTEVQQKLEAKCRDDFDMHIKTRVVGNTFYIYLPTDKPMFDYEAQKEKGDSLAEKKDARYLINFIDGKFDQNNFNIEYDVVDRKKSTKEDYGYSSSYTDSYMKLQNNLFVAISDTFFDLKETSTQKNPEFFVLVVTDIVKGIESRSTFYLQDFKRYMLGDIPYEEYMKRYIADTKGGQKLIGDEIGTHIDYKEVHMADFLAKQMINRIQFKFQRSDFQPGKDYDVDVIGQIADTVRYYKFDGFNQIKLNNLRMDKKFIFTKDQLTSFGDDKETTEPAVSKDGGKLIHIMFENGKANFIGEDGKPLDIKNAKPDEDKGDKTTSPSLNAVN